MTRGASDVNGGATNVTRGAVDLNGRAESGPIGGYAVEVSEVWKYFGDLPALRGLSFTLEPGRFLTIFGPNGAGKTTLLRVLSTLLAPTKGSARLMGLDVRSGAGDLRRKIGLISHNTLLYPNLTALENLVFYGTLYGLPHPKERATRLLTQLGLAARMDQRVRVYSRGMQQRLSIARALLHDPELILLDEPYTGLDEQAARTLKGLLRNLHDGRRTLILTTHNLEQGLQLCDDVAIQVRGRFVYRQAAAALDPRTFPDLYLSHVEPASA